MRVSMPFGRRRVEAEVPDENLAGVLVPHYPAPLEDPAAAVSESLASPIGSPSLSDLVRGKRSLCMAVPDGTRPFPGPAVIPGILASIEAGGIRPEDITILIATGLHRPYAREELEEIVGADVVARYRVVNHRARDLDSHAYLGATDLGVPVHVDRAYLEADFRMVAGLVEPHMNAGFSGGRKLICPGICSMDTLRVLHSTPFQVHPRATNLVLEGNPFHENAVAAAHMARVDFAVHAAVDDHRRITGIWSGELMQSHRVACEAVERAVVAFLDEPADITITSCAGHPLDCNLYQASKGMIGALPITRQGGTIVCAAACNEGLGSEEFAHVLLSHETLESLWEDLWNPDYFVIDQWGGVKQAEASGHAEIMLLSELEDDLARRSFVTPIASLDEGLQRALAKHGREARIAVIPDGPYVVPQLR